MSIVIPRRDKNKFHEELFPPAPGIQIKPELLAMLACGWLCHLVDIEVGLERRLLRFPVFFSVTEARIVSLGS